MELELWWMIFSALLGGFLATCWLLLKNANEWFFVRRLGQKQHALPPGDMGWPFIGNMWSFLVAFKYGNPDSFISSFVTRFGRTGIYKAFMFGSPSIIVTTPETCRQILMDDKKFKIGWPKVVTHQLLGRKSFSGLSGEEHKRLRRLTAAPINGHKALTRYHDCMKNDIVTSLDDWASREEPIEFLTEIRKTSFKIIMYIFLSGESDPIIETLEELYSELNSGIRSMAINLPGFAYHRAVKARKKLVKILQAVVDGRRRMRNNGDLFESERQKDMMDMLIGIEDESGNKMDDEEIIDIILMYLNAGHESSAHAIMWAVLFLEEHPEYFNIAKAEQEEILKKRPSTEKGLSLQEIRQMEYLPKVIDETLRVINISLSAFREATCDASIGGYIIPQGWKVLVWFRAVHLDSENHSNPYEFNPSRWNEHKPKAGSYIPFGTGSRHCPGSDLANLEISIFLHYFLLNYRLERLNPRSKLKYLPHTRPADKCLVKIRKIP